jgi:predicted MFS family arabinose efflux permease
VSAPNSNSALDSSPSLRRNIAALAALQALSSTTGVALASISALAGAALAPQPELATLPITCYVLGGALSTLFASLLMAKWGRRVGFQLGIAVGMLGAAVCAVALQLHQFLALCLGSAVLGVYSAFSSYYRFAAADAAPNTVRSRMISLVLAGGLVGAVVGPESAKWTRTLGEVPFVGTYLSLVVGGALALGVTFALQLPRGTATPTKLSMGSAQTLLAKPGVVAAMTSSVVGYAVMIFLMTATPLAMHHHHHGFDDTAWVIEWHVLGMFAPSFVTGRWVQRWGAPRVILAGALLMLGCVATNLAGVSVTHFWIALVLLGVGWNLMFVGATSLLTAVCAEPDKAVAQGLNELFTSAANAAASALVAVSLGRFGWQALNWAAVPIVLLGAGVAWRSQRALRLAAS